MELVLDISFALQNLRDAQPESLVALLFYLGEALLGFSIVAGGLVHWCVDKKLGQRMLFSYAVGYGINQTVKNIACIYRPWILDSRLQVMPVAEGTATGYSFPSGHTVSVSSVLASLAMSLRKGWSWILCAVGILFICFVRVFVGAHTLLDVSCAVLIAFFAAGVVRVSLEWADKKPGRDIAFTAVGVLLTTAVTAYLLAKPYPSLYIANAVPLVDQQNLMIDVFKASAMLYGAFLGWLLERRIGNFTTDGSFKQRGLRLAAGAIIVGAWFAASKPTLLALGLGLELTEFIKHFMLIFLMMGLYPAAIARWQKARR